MSTSSAVAPSSPEVVAVCGNPSPGSRTLALTTDMVTRLTSPTGPLAGASSHVFDLSELGPRVLAWGDADVVEAREVVGAARLVVVATPVYKGSMTGLLKAFLDTFDLGELAGALAVPVTVAASPGHALAGPTHLEPVLRELGLLVPGGTLHVPDKALADEETRGRLLADWIAPRHQLLATARKEG